MAKVIRKNFEDFKGNDRGASDITRAPGYSANTKNILMLSNSSISKRKGFRFTGSVVGGGMFVYSYLDKDSGATLNRIIEVVPFAIPSTFRADVGQYNVYVLPYKTAIVSISTTNTNATYSHYVDSNGDFIQDLKVGGVSESGYPKNFGDGKVEVQAISGYQSVPATWTVDDSHTGSEFVCFYPTVRDLAITETTALTAGVVNGTQDNVTTINVDAGHEISTGDTVYITRHGISGTVDKVKVSATTATSISIYGTPISVLDNTPIYFHALENIVSIKGGRFGYFHGAPYTKEVFGGRISKREKDLGHFKASGVNQRNCFYFVHSDSYPMKYDGFSFYRAGLPTPLGWHTVSGGNIRIEQPGAASTTVTTNIASSGVGSITGLYRYAYTFVMQDGQGNVIESDITELGSITVSAVSTISLRMLSAHTSGIGAITDNSVQAGPTYNLSYVAPNVNMGDNVYVYIAGGWAQKEVTAVTPTTITLASGGSLPQYSPIFIVNEDTRSFGAFSGYCDGTLSGVSFIGSSTRPMKTNTVDGTGLNDAYPFFLSETIYFRNRRTGNYEYYSDITKLTTVPTIDVNDWDVHSSGMKIAIYRTLNGGQDYYLVDEIPHDGINPINFYSDTKLDSQLGAKYIPPTRPPAPPPKASIISTHQGLQILVGGEDNPNTIFFSEPDNIESYPVATNSFDLPFTLQGPITGVASDQDLLIVFKERGRAIVRGELFSGNFSIEVLEDGIGCVAHASIVKTPAGIIFLSVQGFHRTIGGQLDFDFHKRMTRDFDDFYYKQELGVEISATDALKPALHRAVACNDYINYLYICHIPAETGIPGHNKAENYGKGKWYCYDYSNDAWIDYTFGDDDFSGARGLFMFEDKLHMAGKYIAVESSYNSTDDYADSTEPINMVLQDSWFSGEEPSLLKKFLRVKLWSLAYEYFVGAYVTLKTYLDFNSSTAHTTATMDFTNSNTKERLVKLRAGQKARSLMVEFNNNNLHEAPVITGYELEVAPVFDKEIKE